MFIGKNNKFTMEISPKGNIYDKEIYTEIEEDVLNLTGRLPIGMPALMLEIIELIRTDIINIVGFCIGVIFIFLIITFKKIKIALITLIPLLTSLYLTLVSMELFNIDLNIFSIIAFPIILGIGIDSSIHLEHRIIENKESIPYIIEHTGKAVILTSVTTILGFGSLSFSSHQGISSIGLTVVLGMSISLINSLTLLPALNSIFKIKERQINKNLKEQINNII
jgi:predicted RND superfamily exporter protein